jgi:phospholipase/carboxylesterase
MSLSGPRFAPKSGGAPKSLVILCHGYGSNGDDLIALAPHWAPLLPDTEFVSPNAPQAVPGMAGAYQWFGISNLDPEVIAQGARTAGPVLDEFIDQELERTGLSADRLALVGFSQGTMLSLHVGLRRKAQIASIVGYSGALAMPEKLTAEMQSNPPVQLVHGDADDVLPVRFMVEALETLRAAGVQTDWHISHRMAHSIDQDGLMLGGKFLQKGFAT